MIENTRRKDIPRIQWPANTGQLKDWSPNAGLWLDKFILNQSSEANLDGLKKRSKKITAKGVLVEEVASIPVSDEYEQFYDRWKTGLGKLTRCLGVAKAQGRIAIGLGDESVLETSVTLHRTYGVPYLPGSALKGLAASYARNRIGDHWGKRKDGYGYAYKVVFGTTAEAGYITFHDALYVPKSGGGRPLRPDVITVHHPDYYQNKNKPPADWDDPNPVPFLTATGNYLIAISAVPGCEVWLSQTWRILRLALKEEGIGAKTSSGYGRMELSAPESVAKPEGMSQ